MADRPTSMPKLPLLSAAQAAFLLKCTPRWLQQLVDEGRIAKQGRGKYDIVAAVHGQIDFTRDDSRRSSKSASASRVQDARARQIELKNAEAEGRLVDIVEHEELFIDCFGTMKSKLLGLPARIGKRDIALRRQVETEINAILEACSAQFAKGSAALKATGASGEADDGDDA